MTAHNRASIQSSARTANSGLGPEFRVHRAPDSTRGCCARASCVVGPFCEITWSEGVFRWDVGKTNTYEEASLDSDITALNWHF